MHNLSPFPCGPRGAETPGPGLGPVSALWLACFSAQNTLGLHGAGALAPRHCGPSPGPWGSSRWAQVGARSTVLTTHTGMGGATPCAALPPSYFAVGATRASFK